MELEINPYKVYIKLNADNYITAVNSSAFILDATGWIEIDSGYGDKYHHAQGNYFPIPLYDDMGRFNYKYVDGAVIAIPEEEKPEIEPIVSPTTEERIAELETALSLLLEGATE